MQKSTRKLQDMKSPTTSESEREGGAETELLTDGSRCMDPLFPPPCRGMEVYSLEKIKQRWMGKHHA